MFARLLLSLSLLAITSLVYADCPMQKKQVRGQVEMAGEPVDGAVVEAHWDEERSSDLSARARSDAEGLFELSMSIDTYDGRTLGARERCGYLPKRVELAVRHESAREFSRTYKYEELEKPLSIKLRGN